ncbi:phosphate acetyltransferase [Candidatus Pantoea edessiphila]|uniref:Phosphate acetyltransferase n=1 Tax=Candidatus Pantoea edessiphila TaxID=2044610 RepID=A0A2P5T379_9GAMM|nr:phosphate acetyltransferase [Candidatus Pantoea edessiphila]
MIIPTCNNVGLNSVCLGVIRVIEQKNINIKFFRPIIQDDILNQSNDIFSKYSLIPLEKSLKITIVESLLSANRKDILIEEIIDRYHFTSNTAEMVLIQGISTKYQFSIALNYEIAKALNAEIIFVMSTENISVSKIKDHIKLTQNNFGGIKNKNIIGVIINKINIPTNKSNYIYYYTSEVLNNTFQINKKNHVNFKKLFLDNSLPVLGLIPWSRDLITIRAVDIYHHLSAKIINEGDMKIRRIKHITFCIYSLSDIVKNLHSETLVITSADRPEVIIAICLAVMNGVKISAILLTGNYKINNHISKLCENAFKTGLPVFLVTTNIWQTYHKLQVFDIKIPFDDTYRIKKTQEYIASFIHSNWIKSLTLSPKYIDYLSPPAFRYKLTSLARKAKKCIVLPEGNELRIIKAAVICTERKIASCILLGCPYEIRKIALTQNINLNIGIKIINPVTIREKYISRLVELRKNKGMTMLIAKKQLEDNIVLGTMMLENNEVDGLVSGAIHTTADTIKPSLQIIKTTSNNSLVSSIFFMLLPEQVVIYGDCAINPNPTPIQLAEIAIQSADSAKAFGIDPRVAMISYSTGNSGKGNDVDKVREATLIAQKKRPDLVIDGPLQYDAAITEDVAKSKAPNSKVAGRATVFIFPDLNTGNTTYKAVQRSANLMSIGPMLQGISKPVNDLSRGASVDDIIYTIALTVIQSLQKQKNKY